MLSPDCIKPYMHLKMPTQSCWSSNTGCVRVSLLVQFVPNTQSQCLMCVPRSCFYKHMGGGGGSSKAAFDAPPPQGTTVLLAA